MFEELREYVLAQLERIGDLDSYDLIFVETQGLAKKIADRMDQLLELGVPNERILAFVDAMERDLFLLLETALAESKNPGRRGCFRCFSVFRRRVGVSEDDVVVVHCGGGGGDVVDYDIFVVGGLLFL